MRLKTLDIAIAEAERFIAAAKSFRAQADRIDSGQAANPWLGGGMLAAYTKRASLDTSRALSAIRKRDA